MTQLPRRLLHVEGLAVLVGALVVYFDAGYGWLLLVLLVLAPDLSMLGYLGGPVVGALTYDVAHTYVLPIALGVIGVVGDSDAATQIALVWLVHIGGDRLLGYGLKYPTSAQDRNLRAQIPVARAQGGFKDTHLQRV